MKHCKRCNKDKELSAFYIDKRRNRSFSFCKTCCITATKAANHKWRKQNPEKNKVSEHKTKLKAKYGISLDTFTELWIQQNKACAICKRPISLSAKEKASKPHIDHCHVSGVVRGLLCLTCNTGLGMLGDSIDLLDAARQYLLLRGAPAITKLNSDAASVSAECNNTIH